MLAMLNAKVQWQVSPHVSRFTAKKEIRWLVEINDPLSGRSSVVSAHFKTRSSAEWIAKKLNEGMVPADYGFHITHQLMD